MSMLDYIRNLVAGNAEWVLLTYGLGLSMLKLHGLISRNILGNSYCEAKIYPALNYLEGIEKGFISEVYGFPSRKTG